MNYRAILDESAQAQTPTVIPDNLQAFTLVLEHQTFAQELDICLRSGDHWAFPYAYKTSIQFDLSGKLIIHFTTHTITITGRNLMALYNGLIQHRISQISELDHTFDDLPEESVVITEIKIKQL